MTPVVRSDRWVERPVKMELDAILIERQAAVDHTAGAREASSAKAGRSHCAISVGPAMCGDSAPEILTTRRMVWAMFPPPCSWCRIPRGSTDVPPYVIAALACAAQGADVGQDRLASICVQAGGQRGPEVGVDGYVGRSTWRDSGSALV